MVNRVISVNNQFAGVNPILHDSLYDNAMPEWNFSEFHARHIYVLATYLNEQLRNQFGNDYRAHFEAGLQIKERHEPPKFPAATRNRNIDGWVELEFTVLPDGRTGDIVVTNSNPRRTFDNAAINAVAKWRYQPVMRDGKAVEQRAAVRIRFAEE